MIGINHIGRLGKDSQHHPTDSGSLGFALLLVPGTFGQALGWSPGHEAAVSWPRNVPWDRVRDQKCSMGGVRKSERLLEPKKESLKKQRCKELAKTSKEWIRASLGRQTCLCWSDGYITRSVFPWG